MLNRWKPIFSCLYLTILMAIFGCSPSGDGKQTSTSSAGGSGNVAATSGNKLDSSTPKPPSDRTHSIVNIETSLGNITLKLDADKVPETVNNFLDYVKANHYDQTIVHQVYRGQGFLAGGYDANYAEKRGRTPIRNEADRGGKNRRGTISMVRLPDAIDSATCQFFINVSDNPNLDHRARTVDGYGYCVFGEVTKGMEVVDAIGNAQVHDTPNFDRTPVQKIEIKSIRWIQ